MYRAADWVEFWPGLAATCHHEKSQAKRGWCCFGDDLDKGGDHWQHPKRAKEKSKDSLI